MAKTYINRYTQYRHPPSRVARVDPSLLHAGVKVEARGRRGPDVSGVNLRIPDDLSQTRVANHFAVAPSVRGVPLMHGWMELIKPHPTM